MRTATEDGLPVSGVADAASEGDVVMVLLPDEQQGAAWNDAIRDGIAPGKLLMFAHGFSIHYGEIEPDPGVDVFMVAPRVRAIWCAAYTRRAEACRACSRFIRMRPAAPEVALA